MSEEPLIAFHRLRDVADPLLPDAVEIYQRSFPSYEQLPVAFFLRYLHRPDTDENVRFHYYCMTCNEAPVGFTFFEIGDEVEGLGKPGYLWYLGIAEEHRGKGLGGRLYEFVQQVVKEHGCRALTYEIEMADLVRERHGEEAAKNASRRRAWYQRLGANAIQGIHYQYPPEGTWEVMVHLFDALSPEQALELVMPTLDGVHVKTGEIWLD